MLPSRISALRMYTDPELSRLRVAANADPRASKQLIEKIDGEIERRRAFRILYRAGRREAPTFRTDKDELSEYCESEYPPGSGWDD